MHTPSDPSASPAPTRALARLRLDPARALQALRTLIANPDDTAQVFTIIEAFSGRAPLRLLARFRRDPAGARLLAERPRIVPFLSDRSALRRLPAGSLGRAYLAFVESEGVTADGLVDASERGETGELALGRDFDYLRDRLRDTHDLWHALTGYRGDVVGEAALLAFSLAQTRNPGVALIVLAALVRTRDPVFARLLAVAFRDGLRAAWLPAVEWESLLAQPLDEVRRRLRVPAPPAYVPVRTSELRAAAELAAAA